MGANSLFHHEHHKLFQKLQKRFILVPQKVNKQQNIQQFYTLHQKLSNAKYLLRMIILQDETEAQIYQQILIRKLSYTNLYHYGNHNQYPLSINLIAVKQYHIIKQQGKQKIYILFDIGQTQTLSDFITLHTIRQISQYPIFKEEQLMNNLKELLRALQMLKFLGHSHKKISLETVFIDKNRKFILSDPLMTTQQCNQMGKFYNIRQKQEYLSPQSFQSLKYKQDKSDQYLSSVFSIGLIGIKLWSLCTKQFRKSYQNNLIEFYDRINYQVNLEELLKKIQLFKNSQFKNLLYRLLGSVEQRMKLFNQKIIIEKRFSIISQRGNKKQRSPIQKMKELNKYENQKYQQNQFPVQPYMPQLSKEQGITNDNISFQIVNTSKKQYPSFSINHNIGTFIMNQKPHFDI